MGGSGGHASSAPSVVVAVGERWCQRSPRSRAPALEATNIRAGQCLASWRNTATRFGLTLSTTTLSEASGLTNVANSARNASAKEAPRGWTSTGGTCWPAALQPASNRKLLADVPRSSPYSISKRRRLGLSPLRQVKPGSISIRMTRRPAESLKPLTEAWPGPMGLGVITIRPGPKAEESSAYRQRSH